MAKDSKVTKTKTRKAAPANPHTKRRYFKPLIRAVGNLHQNTSMSA